LNGGNSWETAIFANITILRLGYNPELFKRFEMRLGTIKILLLLLCLSGTSLINAQVVDEPVVPQVSVPRADTLTVTGHLLKQIKAAPVPGINGPQDIHLDRTESLKFLERFSGSNSIWRRSNDPLREASGTLYGWHPGRRKIPSSTSSPNTLLSGSGYRLKSTMSLTL
jgi:hypothetical protein